MLTEKFHNKLKSQELQGIVNAIRSGSKKDIPVKKVKIKEINVEFAWHNFNGTERKYTTDR